MTTKEKSIVHISLPDVVMDAMTDGLSDPERAAHNYQQAAIEHSAAATEYEAAKAGSPDEGKAMAKLGNAASKMDGYKRAMAQLGLGDPEGPGRAIFVGGSIGSEIEASGLLDTDKGSKDAFHTVNAGLLRLGYGENAAQGTLFTTTQGPPRQRRTGEIDLRPNTPNDVLDAYTRRGGARPWDTAEVAYFKETITTDAAAERAEGGAVAESAISLSEEKMAIRSIAHSLPVTDEVLADGGATVRMYLDDRLPRLVRGRINRQAVVGNNAAPNVQGVVNAATHAANTQTVNYAAPTFARLVLAAVSDAQEAVFNNGEAVASHVLMNASVWAAIKKLQVTHSGGDSGQYVLGNPADAEIGRRLWDMTVIPVPSTVLPTGTTNNDVVAVVGDFDTFGEFYLREDATVERGFVANQFGEGKSTLRAIARCAFVHTRVEAFAKVMSNV